MDVPFFWSFFDPAQAMPHTDASSLIFSVPNRLSEEASAVDQNHRSLKRLCCCHLFAHGVLRFVPIFVRGWVLAF